METFSFVCEGIKFKQILSRVQNTATQLWTPASEWEYWVY